MKVKELFQKDPTAWRIANEGVSNNNDSNLDTLGYELRTFVCEGEYHSGLVKILRGYLDNVGKVQKSAWVSGFYGSGKSHLVKVLRYLWTDQDLGQGQTARTVATLPDDVSELLKELSTLAKRYAGLHGAGGTLKAGVGSVRLRLLGIILQSMGLPEKISIARLRMDLQADGKLDAVEAAIGKLKRDPAAEFARPYTSLSFQKAYLESYPHLGDPAQVGRALLAEYPAKVDDISIDEMLKVIRRAVSREKGLPCTVVVLDEVQQFINNDNNVANEVQEVVEACSNQLDGRVLFVGTGQSALSDTPALQKLMGRFTVKVHLKDNDVEKVVRTVVLRKKEDKRKSIEEMVAKHSGEITRQLKSTRLATRSDDDKAYVADYPILPVRRRFWEQVLHSIDPSGTAAQMRTQLRVAHEACRALAERELGAVIPADFLYDQQANELVISGEIQKRFQEIIDEQKTKPDGQLRSRICGLVFLINKLPREAADTGVRANVEHLADLLTDDLGSSATTIREKIPSLAEKLRAEGILMDVDGEFRLQTTEGATWEAEYRRRRASAMNSDAQIAAQRGQQLSKAIQKDLASLTHPHGQAKVGRRVLVHHGSDSPEGVEELTVWVRDGFQEAEGAVIQDIQRRSVEDATIHVLVPKLKADELKQALAGAIAAEETMNTLGSPTAREGQEARASMVSRQASEGARVASVIEEIVGGARVFLSGGQELPRTDLRTTVQNAAGQVLQRLYPKFDVADSPNWGTVWKKAKEGSASALSAVGYGGDPQAHAVAAEIIRFIGAGKRGSDIVAHFTAPPFGWPKDAVDATLAVLLVSGHLAAKVQGQTVRLADLDQRKVGQADFRTQHPVLTAAQKLKIKKLFQDVGHPFSAGDESAAAPSFVQLLGELARRAGGEPPAPESPRGPEVIALEGLGGNDLLFALFEHEESLRGKSAAWKRTAAEIEQRLPVFRLAERLIRHEQGLPTFSAHATTLEAIRSNRSLLHDPDPVAPLVKEVASGLRAALTGAHRDYHETLLGERMQLEAQAAWKALSEAKRDALLRSAEIKVLPVPAMGTDAELADALDSCSLSAWRTETAALSTRFAQALTGAIKDSEPKAQRLSLPSATLRNEEQLEEWIGRVRSQVSTALSDGPVIL